LLAAVALILLPLPSAVLLEGFPALPGVDPRSVRRQLSAVFATVEEQLDKLPAPPFSSSTYVDQRLSHTARHLPIGDILETQTLGASEEVWLPPAEDLAALPAGQVGSLPSTIEALVVRRPAAMGVDLATDEVVSYLSASALPQESDPVAWRQSGSSGLASRPDAYGRPVDETRPPSRRESVKQSTLTPRQKRGSTSRTEASPMGFLASGDFLDRGFDQANVLLARIPGLAIEEIIITQGYSSNAIPQLRGVPREASRLGHDLDWGASAAFRWRNFTPRRSIVFSYEPSMIRRLQYPEWNTTNHNLRLGIERKLSPRWEMRFAGRGVSQGVEQFFFDPPVLRRIENPPLTLDDLADAVASGRFTDDEIAALLTGSPVVDRAGEADLDVRRVLTTGARVSTSYRRSRRLSIEAAAEFLRSKTASGGREEDEVSRRGFISSTTSARAETGLKYELSPDSQLGVELSQQRTESSLRRANYTTATASYDKEFGRGWRAGIRAGAGTSQGKTFRPLPSTNGLPPDALGATWIAGGSLGYDGRAHKFSISSLKNVGDNLGLGSRSSLSTEAQYQWTPRGAAWSLFGGGNSYSADMPTGGGTIESKIIRAGIIRRVGANGAVTTEYNYGSIVTPFTGILPSLSRHRVQVSFIWKPSGER